MIIKIILTLAAIVFIVLNFFKVVKMEIELHKSWSEFFKVLDEIKKIVK